ncbi:DUF6420 family protein [Streptomyces sp. NPDC047461]|uniref:DUF6420 family protein n=1 Tax=Streptomyces sp. NPDC047461 TaxID=3155619 RepID=UPI0033F2E8FF
MEHTRPTTIPSQGRPAAGSTSARRRSPPTSRSLDHLSCPAQSTDEKTAGFKRLALAAEEYCVRAGCRHLVVFSDGVHRFFEVRKGSIALTPFVRAALAVELGDFSLTDRLLQESEALAGPVRRDGEGDQASGV